jgi:AraC family transcriptional regulator
MATIIEPRFVDSPAMNFAGIDAYFTFDQCLQEIPKQWERYVPTMHSIVGRATKIDYGICHTMGEGGFRYMCGVEILPEHSLPEGYSVLAIPAQRFAVFPHEGDLSTLSETVDMAWKDWLPSSGCEAAQTPLMIERYGEEFDPLARRGDIELWFAIRS